LLTFSYLICHKLLRFFIISRYHYFMRLQSLNLSENRSEGRDSESSEKSKDLQDKVRRLECGIRWGEEKRSVADGRVENHGDFSWARLKAELSSRQVPRVDEWGWVLYTKVGICVMRGCTVPRGMRAREARRW